MELYSRLAVIVSSADTNLSKDFGFFVCLFFLKLL